MKMVKRWITLFLALSTLTWAEGDTLQQKIAQLQHAPQRERFKLMNEIKRELARMNESQRKEALGKLRASMMHGNGNRAGDGKGMHPGMHGGEGMRNMMHKGEGMQEHMRQNMPQRPMFEQTPGMKDHNRPTPMHEQTPGTKNQNRPIPNIPQIPKNRPGNIPNHK
jgi:hypothetical protein